MHNKRIILMYISEVSGHHSATLAIERALKMNAPHTAVLNLNGFKYTNPISEKIINRLYMSVIKATPQIWDFLYDNPQVAKNLSKIKDSIHKFNSPKLKKLFDRFKPDIVCCTQAFPCGMVADYKRDYRSNMPLIAVLTDYVPHSYWIYDTVDYYIVPTEEVGSRLIMKGVPAHKVKPLGIPFDPRFNDPIDKEAVCRRLGLVSSLPTLLIMGGGQGLGPVKTIIRSLEKAKVDFQEIIVTGSNKKLYNSLRKKSKKYRKKMVVLGYSNEINALMSVSNLIITKPGGITTAEALSKKLPMIIVKPIPGQEANNTEYLIGKEAALKIDDPGKIQFAVEELLKNPHLLAHLSVCAGKISRPNASLDVAKLLLELKNG